MKILVDKFGYQEYPQNILNQDLPDFMSPTGCLKNLVMILEKFNFLV